MAEINVERRPAGRGPLIALLAVLLLAALAWVLMRRGGDDYPAPAPAPIPVDTAAMPADTTAVAAPAPVDSASPAPDAAPGIVGDDTSGRAVPDSAPSGPSESRLGNP